MSNVLMPAWSNGGILAFGGQANETDVAPYFVLVVRGGANGYRIVNTVATTLLQAVENDAHLSEVQLSGAQSLTI